MAITISILGGQEGTNIQSLSWKPGRVTAGTFLLLALASSIQGTADNSPSDTKNNFLAANSGFAGASFGADGPNLMLFTQPNSVATTNQDTTSVLAPPGQSMTSAAAEIAFSGVVDGTMKSGTAAQDFTSHLSLTFNNVSQGDLCIACVGAQGATTDVFTNDQAWNLIRGSGTSTIGQQFYGAWLVAPASGLLTWKPTISVARNWCAVGFNAAP
jgi:hypothetical protein